MTYRTTPLQREGMTFTRRRTTREQKLAMDLSRHRDVQHFHFEDPRAMAAYADAVANSDYRRKDYYAGGTTGVDNDWQGMMQRCQTGDQSLVAASDALLAKFEDLTPMRSAWSDQNDVVGSLPNVPAYLSGHPMSMRRRVRVAKEQAPLAILVDVAASSGVKKEIMAKRGALVLALVRALSARRPLVLYVTAGLAGGSEGDQDGQNDSAFVSCRLDTAPLDLARAAYMLGSSDWRQWAFSIAHTVGFDPRRNHGGWPFRDLHAARRAARQLYAGVIPEADELFFIGPMHLRDQDLQDPEAWLTRMIAEHGDSENEQVAA